jgi:tryptophan synthase alpha chain
VTRTLARLRRETHKPLCVGFGVSKPQHVRQLKAAGADGAIVGSALVAVVESTHGKPGTMLAQLRRAVRRLKAATR